MISRRWLSLAFVAVVGCGGERAAEERLAADGYTEISLGNRSDGAMPFTAVKDGQSCEGTVSFATSRLRESYVAMDEGEARRRLAPVPARDEAFPIAVARRLRELRALCEMSRVLHRVGIGSAAADAPRRR